MSDNLLSAVATLPKCSPYLHVPAQSGSNRVLRQMRRGYTIEDYHEMMERIRAQVPGYAVSSDFIVGFCGETDDDFQQTVELVDLCRFKNSFIFKYSERPGTKGAEHLKDDVPESIKKQRNNELLSVQNAISAKDNNQFIGREVEILVEGPSKMARDKQASGPVMQMVGRTHCDRIVVYEGNERHAGQLVKVVIYDAHSHTLFGEVVTSCTGPEVFAVDLTHGR